MTTKKHDAPAGQMPGELGLQAARVDAKIKTYEATVDGRKIRCTVPEDPRPEEILVEALRDCLTPEAITTIAAHLSAARTRHAEVNRQVAWFTDLLVHMLGGPSQYNRLMEEVGL